MLYQFGMNSRSGLGINVCRKSKTIGQTMMGPNYISLLRTTHTAWHGSPIVPLGGKCTCQYNTSSRFCPSERGGIDWESCSLAGYQPAVYLTTCPGRS